MAINSYFIDSVGSEILPKQIPQYLQNKAISLLLQNQFSISHAVTITTADLPWEREMVRFHACVVDKYQVM